MRQEKKNKLMALFVVLIMVAVAFVVMGLWIADNFFK